MDPNKTDTISLITQSVPVIACRKCKTKIDVSGCQMFDVIACPDCHTAQSVPVLLDHFLLVERMGAGGMASVYRAYDTQLSRQVAIKIMRHELSEDPKFVANFLREARNAAQLNHPNVVQIYSVGEEKGQPYIVMELLSGGRLDAMIEAGKPLEEDFVLRVGLGIAEGLSAAAAAGMVHGDVKPQNILFDRNGEPKIADFGLARSRTHQPGSSEIWGTPYYIAPEKVKYRREDARSDIYSLGATLYHAMTNQPPFEAETAAEVVKARLDAPAPNILEVIPALRPATGALITRMLEPDPAVRYPNYASLLSDLHKVVTQPPAPVSSVRPKAKAAATVAPAPPDRGRRRLLFIALNSVTLLVAGGVGFWLYRRKRKPSTPAPAPGPGPVPGPAPVPAAPNASAFNPFSADQQTRLEATIANFNQEKYPVAINEWAAMAKEFRPSSLGRYWMALFTALPPWLEQNDALTRKRLEALSRLPLPPPSKKDFQPDQLPRQLALLMLGENVPCEADIPYPTWFRDLHGFFSGTSAALRGSPVAAGLLDRYLASAPAAGEPTWPYAFKPTAQRLRGKLGSPTQPAATAQPPPATKPKRRAK